MRLERIYPLGSLMDNNTEKINYYLDSVRRYIDEAKHWIEYDLVNDYANFYYAERQVNNYISGLEKLIPEYNQLRQNTESNLREVEDKS